jgi:hypothetical protein
MNPLNQSSPMGSASRAITTVGVTSVIAYGLETFYGVPQVQSMAALTLVAGLVNALWKSLRG